MKKEQSFGFLNRAGVALFIMVTVPSFLVIVGFIFVAMQGRVPGGTDSSCEHNISDTSKIRIDVYAYQSGLSLFQLQKFSVSEDSSSWRKLFEDDVITPHDINCDDNIVQTSDSLFYLFNQKTIAISADNGVNWNLHHVCDEPYLVDGSCNEDTLNIVSIDLAENGQGRILVQESIVDEYGVPLTENGQPLINQEFVLVTSDFGNTWELGDSK